jgi:hypothetical protein
VRSCTFGSLAACAGAITASGTPIPPATETVRREHIQRGTVQQVVEGPARRGVSDDENA